MPAEERRVVTVLFAAVPGLERLPASMSAEDYREIVDALFTRLRRVIEARGGTVDKFAGEAVMAVFGAPVAHEDDPLRAVRAALALRKEIDLFAASHGLDLHAAAGINTGEVLWGSVGGDRPTAMGDVVNVANRIETEAEPGQVLITKAVERAVAARVRCRPLAEIQVRGRKEKVEVFEAVEEARAASSVLRAEGASARMIGREADLARLMEAFRSGKGAFAVVEGESGLGKTRLLQEVRHEVLTARAPAWIGVGHCIEGSALPLAPFAEIVRSAMSSEHAIVPGRREGEGTSTWVSGVLSDLIPAAVERENLAHLMTLSMGQLLGETRVRFLDPGRVRQETHHAWEKWIRALAARAPVLVCVEDIHAADPSTLALLEFLAEHLRGERVAIFASSRPGARLPRGYERLPLAELPPDDARLLARELFGRALGTDLATFLVEQGAGNPHYIEELSRYLLEEGLTGGNPVEFTTRPERLPDGLRGLLVARIDTATPEAREALKSGSVFGRAFWIEALGKMVERDVTIPLAQAERRRLIALQPASLLPGDSEYAFRQTPLRDAAYSLLTRKERTRLHERAAGLLEERAPELGRRIVILAAAHREAAEQNAEAARLWERAAAEAAGAQNWDEALSSAREAQRLGGSTEAAITAVRALQLLGQYEQAIAEASEVLALPSTTPEQRARALILTALAEEKRGSFEASIRASEEVLKAPPTEGTRLEALSQRAGALLRLGRYRESLADAQEVQRGAQAIVERTGGREGKRLLSNAFNALARVQRQIGSEEEALQSYKRCLEINIELGNRGGVASATNGVGLIHNQRNEHEPARRAFEDALVTYREIGDRWGIAMCLTNLCITHFAEGRFEKSFETASECLAIRRDIGDRWGEALILGNIGAHHLDMGRLSQAEEAFSQSFALQKLVGDRQGQARSHEMFSRLAVLRGDAAAALDQAELACGLYAEIGHSRRLAAARVHKAEALAEAGRGPEAEALLEQVLADAEILGESSGTAGALTLLARCRASRDAAQAEALARRALEAAGPKRPSATAAAALGALALATGSLEDLAAARAAFLPEHSFAEHLRMFEAESEIRRRNGDAGGAKRAAEEGRRLAEEAGAAGPARRLAEWISGNS